MLLIALVLAVTMLRPPAGPLLDSEDSSQFLAIPSNS